MFVIVVVGVHGSYSTIAFLPNRMGLVYLDNVLLQYVLYSPLPEKSEKVVFPNVQQQKLANSVNGGKATIGFTIYVGAKSTRQGWHTRK